MATITIPNIPEDLHRRLKSAAERLGHSIDEEVPHVLAEAFPPISPFKPIEPAQPLQPFTNDWLLEAIREGRE